MLAHEVFDAIVISLDNKKLPPNYVGSKLGQCMHNSQHLLIIDGIVPLHSMELLAFKNNGILLLHQDFPNPIS